jgi:hypothetical protein
MKKLRSLSSLNAIETSLLRSTPCTHLLPCTCSTSSLLYALLYCVDRYTGRSRAIDVIDLIDVHGLHPDEAIRTITQRMLSLSSSSTSSSNTLILDIVTGTGHHSYGGTAKLKPAVLQWCRALHRQQKHHTSAAAPSSIPSDAAQRVRPIESVSELASTDGRGGVIRVRFR